MNHSMVNIAFGTALNVNSFLLFVNIPQITEMKDFISVTVEKCPVYPTGPEEHFIKKNK